LKSHQVNQNETLVQPDLTKHFLFLVCGKELHPLSALQLSGFRLHPGPLPEQYRYSMQVQTKRRRKHKKNRHKGSETPATDDQNAVRTDSDEREKRKEKKHKKHEKDAEEKKKRKKEKKKKRSKEDKDI
jgi:mediator of RNA polymerase II transcription subunit 19